MERASQRLIGALALAGTLWSASCAKPSFGAVLAKIDASGGTAGARLFASGAELARSTEDRLRLLKRASAYAPETYAFAAEAVMESTSVSESVALAALDAFLEAGLHGKALGLFGPRLDPERFGAEYAEALIAAESAGAAPRPGPDRLVAAYRANRDPRFLVAAAVDAMHAGDTGFASMALGTALSEGASPPAELLWDAGLTKALAERLPDYGDPADMAISADAARLEGRAAQAAFLWKLLVDSFPYWSWKPYASLARAAGEPGEAAPWPHAPVEGSPAAASTPAAMAAHWYALLAERFPDSAGARAELARNAYDRGDIARGSALLNGPGEDLAVARALLGAGGNAASLALDLAAVYPGSPKALDAAFELLAVSSAWDELESLAASVKSAGTEPPRLWFWKALAAAYRGELDAATAELRSKGPQASGFAAIYDLALIRLVAGDAAGAKDAATIAAGVAKAPEDGAAAMVLLGDAELADGSSERARAAYSAALGLDPSSRQARSRLERSGGSR